MTSKQKLTILDVTRREGISSKTGRHYDMRIAECVLWQNTSEGEDAVVGTITLPDALKDVGKGEYLADFILTRSMEGQLVPRIIALQPYGDGARPSAPTKKQKLTILSVVRREGISSKTGRPYDMRTAQCVLWQATPDGDRAVVGTVPLPEIAKETGKGEYFAEMAMAQSMDGALVPRIVALQPYVSSTRPTATPKAAAAAAA
ncbi:hypothetical protein [Pandoraea commovens]|uniref:Cellulose synthase n=1 Tax=Pandoraea commovens TaxID=2508289 RepID=A0A5E4YZH0_9BURK|nr:cellulose synthase [Pandoraea commovens]